MNLSHKVLEAHKEHLQSISEGSALRFLLILNIALLPLDEF